LQQDPVGYLLIAPFCLFTFVFVLLPVIANIYLSFTNYNLIKMDFVGFKNYSFMFSDVVFMKAVKNTFVFAIFTLVFTMIIGLFLAILLQDKIFGLKFFRTSVYTPYVTSMVSVAMIWLWMYEPSNGIFNKMLEAVGMAPHNWLFDPSTAMGSIIIVSIWKAIGYNMVIYLSGLHGIPKYLYEAAKIDGASAPKRFFFITYPMLRPVTFFLFITGFINDFRVFDQIQIMTGGGPVNSTTTIVHQIYKRAFNEISLGYAAAEAVLLLVIVLIITAVNFKYGNQGNDLEAA
jgi:multiple sugar transport system permease protein/raffinose/stachyose/melibiose transport system permease protein